ncbi:MAG: hypothetical protein HY907_06955 [Deltaproteobacteria bacterium]|nr:hypothetical protein [Deltaproteobacteria bacterium]
MLNGACACLVLGTSAMVATCQEESSFGDCRDAARECFAPFVCRWFSDAYGCHFSADDVPACNGTPAGQVVPPATFCYAGQPLHWTMEQGCIAVSYAAAVASRAADIRAALDAWDDNSCSRLCFGTPAPGEELPDYARAERRLHFGTREEPPGTHSFTYVFENATCRVLGAEVQLDPSALSSLSRAELVHLVGRALGLGAPPPGTDSVMAGNGAEEPSALDDQAMCALYGDPSFCGD